MGKGNAILGYARGAVGSVVFSRTKGQQIIRARNTKPHNTPRINRIFHRAKLSTIYKLTSQLPEGFLEGAFEFMRPRENWQSCFVRYNVKNAAYQPKDWVEDGERVCFGKWQFSDGSLPELKVHSSNVSDGVHQGCIGIYIDLPTPPGTIGNLSKAILSRGVYKEGDIITFLVYRMGVYTDQRPPYFWYRCFTSPFDYYSFALDPGDNRQISVVLRGWSILNYKDDDGVSHFWLGLYRTAKFDPSLVAIVTRREGRKYRVSPSWMVGPASSPTMLSLLESYDFGNRVLISWGYSKKAILYGD